jgi:hypothetical protein
MFLGYPLDYRSLEFIDQAVSTFGKMISWHNNPRKLGIVLVKCLYNNTTSVPHSIEFRQGDRLGNGWSWTVPVYVLNNWEELGEMIAKAEDVPLDGNPHPLLTPPAAGERP